MSPTPTQFAIVIAAVGAAVAASATAVAGLAMYGTGGLVQGRSRCNTVDQRLQAFLDGWAKDGPFGLFVPVDGARRTDEALQAKLYAEKRSNAKTLAETPHGRGGALDLYPVVDGKTLGLGDPQGAAMAEYLRYAGVIAARAKLAGFKWGGDFKSLKDWPHVEVPDWKTVNG